MTEQVITFEAMEQAANLFGSFDENIKLLEREYGVTITCRGADLKVVGDAENVAAAARALNGLLTLINKGEQLTEQNVRYVISLVGEGNEDVLSSMTTDSVCVTAKGRPVKPKTVGQKRYCESIAKNTITFWRGPGRYRQNLPGCGNGGYRLSCQRGEPDHFDPPGGGSGGEVGLPARRPAKQGRPVPAPVI